MQAYLIRRPRVNILIASVTLFFLIYLGYKGGRITSIDLAASKNAEKRDLAKPKYNYPIKILRTSSSVCSGVTRHNLVVVVKSGVHNFAAREEFRAFMKNQTLSCPSFRVGYVFSVGLPRAHGGRGFNRDGNIVNLPGAAGDALEKYDGKSDILMDEINKEIDKYDDLILGDYEDTYFNLSWKTVTNLRWISAFCNKIQGDFFMIIDDDHRMNLSLVESFAKEVKTSYLRTSIHGKIRNHDKAIRSPSSKNFVSYREIPWDDALPYPMGMSQLIGADIVDDMAIATAYTKYVHLNEDVYLGLLAYKLGITLRNVVSMFNHDEYKNYEKKYSPMVAWMRAITLGSNKKQQDDCRELAELLWFMGEMDYRDRQQQSATRLHSQICAKTNNKGQIHNAMAESYALTL
ncbi:hypothetical protein ACTXT7_017299 [Hymenolepis weldensis]